MIDFTHDPRSVALLKQIIKERGAYVFRQPTEFVQSNHDSPFDDIHEYWDFQERFRPVSRMNTGLRSGIVRALGG